MEITDEQIEKLLLTREERKKIKDDWFKTLPHKDSKLPKDLELEAQIRKVLTELTKPLEGVREKIAERCYWDYMGQDSKWHPLTLREASEDMKREMYNRSDRILALISPMIEQGKREIAYNLFEEVICPMCYRLNPQHASMDDGKGCHYCQEREDWQALKETQ